MTNCYVASFKCLQIMTQNCVWDNVKFSLKVSNVEARHSLVLCLNKGMQKIFTQWINIIADKLANEQ